MTKVPLVDDVRAGRPHVVILGAGASRAAFPKGDPRGRQLPVMKDFVEVVGLASELKEAGIKRRGRNFEEIYSELHAVGKHAALLNHIEAKVRAYFASLELPPTPTLYDHLVLSLRPKDIIATFNWDPFLYAACARNYTRVNLPNVVYLHGSVAVGYCISDKRKGAVGTPCSRCGKQFKPSKLLYPIEEKDYASDPAIALEWRALRSALGRAYVFTIFGYSAPGSDVEAVQLMSQAWGAPEQRELEEIEIVDIKSEDELLRTWAPFVHTHHYRRSADFYESWVAQYPRRTCEAMWRQLMEVEFLEPNPIPRNMDFQNLWEWYRPLMNAEKEKGG